MNHIAIIGLGYVGLPLAIEFSKKYPTIGFDLNDDRINELKNGNVLWPLRVALSGSERSPSPFELLWTLGEGESVHRIKMALSKLA